MSQPSGTGSIRRAAPSDEDRLLVLIREFYEIDRHEYDEARVRAALAPLLSGDDLGQVWLISGGPGGAGDPVGYAVVTWGYSLESGGRDALLDEIYVRDRGRGIGARAMEEVLAASAAAGATRMFLETEAHNERVRGFYRSLGFVADDSVWMSREL